MKPSLAIIGSGVAGLSAAYFLQEKFHITLIEKNNYLGGHTNTIQIQGKASSCPVDTGFMVFNEVTYPYLTKFLKKLNVETYNTDMSFSVYDRARNFEYNGSSLNGLFSQRKNLFNISFIKMLLETRRFSQMADEILTQPQFTNLSMKEFITKYKFGKAFTHDFLIPMSSAVWSTPHETMLEFPIQSLVRFFVNHGFLGLDSQHQWKTIFGGSESYKQKILQNFNGEIISHEGAQSIEQLPSKMFEVTTLAGRKILFDQVIIAAHGDEALKMLKHPTPMQKKLLTNFKYQTNEAWVHTDDRFMPRLKSNWSSWNYIKTGNETYTVYWMNRLQPKALSGEKNIFININGVEHLDPKQVLKKITYTHPLFDVAAVAAQADLPQMNLEIPGLNFCGSYFRYGFHEDALMSSVLLCNQLLAKEVL